MQHPFCKSHLWAFPFLLGLMSGGHAQDSTSETCSALFVHNASSVPMRGSTITLEGVIPIVAFVCDRPIRYAGLIDVEGFLDMVSGGEESFASAPPNAVLSIVTECEQPGDVVVELSEHPSSEAGTRTTQPNDGGSYASEI